MMRTMCGLFAALLAVCLVLSARAENAPATAAVGKPAPDFSLLDQTGKTVKLSDFAGKIVVLEWTNPECPFVKRHYNAKTMTTISSQYKEKNVVWLAVNSSHNAKAEAMQKWAQEQGLAYPILMDNSGTVGKAYGAKTTPDMYVIAADGKLAYHGAIDDDSKGNQSKATNHVKAALDDLLAGKPVAVAETKPYGCSVKYGKN